MADPTPADALNALSGVLQAFVPAQALGLPKPGLSIARTETKSAGIGNLVGSSSAGSIAALMDRAVRIQALARFSLWGAVAFDVDQAVDALNTAIFSQQAALASNGILRMTFDSTATLEHFSAATAWRRVADYDVLFEYRYQTVDDTLSLIRPIDVSETATGAQWTITGDLGRWDDVVAPPLSVRGPTAIARLDALAFIADPLQPPSGALTITRTFDGAPPPAVAASLADFLNQVTGPAPVRNVTVTLASVSGLLALLTPDAASIDMGDRNADGIPDRYRSSHLAFPGPLELPTIFDRFEMTFSQPKFDRIAVVYFRA